MYPDSGYKRAHAQSVCTRPFSRVGRGLGTRLLSIQISVGLLIVIAHIVQTIEYAIIDQCHNYVAIVPCTFSTLAIVPYATVTQYRSRLDSLVPRLLPVFQCYTQKNGGAWYLIARDLRVQERPTV